MTNDEAFESMLGLTVEAFGSDDGESFYIEFSDGSELEFMINEDGEMEVSYYKGFLDA